MLVEERQYKGQIDSKLTAMLTKVDSLSEKVAIGINNSVRPRDTHTSAGISAKALLNTITRIVVDNERLHSEVVEKVSASIKF